MLRALLLFIFTIHYAKAQEHPQAVVSIIVNESALNSSINSVGTFTAPNNALLKAELGGRITIIHFKDGESVKENQILFSLHNKEQEAEVKKAEADLILSRSILHRKKELIKKEFISHQDLEEAEAEVKKNEANLALAMEDLQKTIIKAPFDGVLSERQVSEGSGVLAGDPLVRIQALSPIRLTFHIPEKDLMNVRKGDKVITITDAYPDKSFEGKIEAIEPTVNEKTRSITIYARFENEDKLLLPGLYGRVTIESSSPRAAALVVPEKALVIRQDGAYVYKKTGDKAVLTKVALGLRTGDRAEVLVGLNKGDEIILEGQDKIHDGSVINTVLAK